MAQSMKPKDQKLTKPVLQGDPEDEPPMPLPYIPSMPPPSEQPVPPLSDSLPPSVSTPQPHQQPPSPNDVSPIPTLESESTATFTCPSHWSLRPGPQQISADGTDQPGCSILYYQPFSTTDLLNWRKHTPLYSEKPQAMINLESVFQTYQPTWDNCQQNILTFFNTEECW
jgi:hypothetical protein